MTQSIDFSAFMTLCSDVGSLSFRSGRLCRTKVSRNKHHQLLAANGSTTEKYGVRSIPLQFGSQHFECTFVIAIVNQPILEADFFYATRPFNRLEMATTN